MSRRFIGIEKLLIRDTLMHRKRCNGWADEQNVLHLIQNELCHTQGESVTEFFFDRVLSRLCFYAWW